MARVVSSIAGLWLLLGCTENPSGDGNDTDDGSPIPAACEPWCGDRLRCAGGEPTDSEMYEACLQDCAGAFQLAILEDRDVCPMLLEKWMSCVSALTCAEYEHWLSETPEPYPCQTEDGELEIACPGVLG